MAGKKERLDNLFSIVEDCITKIEEVRDAMKEKNAPKANQLFLELLEKKNGAKGALKGIRSMV